MDHHWRVRCGDLDESTLEMDYDYSQERDDCCSEETWQYQSELDSKDTGYWESAQLHTHTHTHTVGSECDNY